MKIVFKKFQLIDVISVVDTHYTSLEKNHEWLMGNDALKITSKNKLNHYWREKITRQDELVCIAEDTGNKCTVGIINILLNTETLELLSFYVHPNYCQLGIDKHLAKHALSLIKEAGYENVNLAPQLYKLTEDTD